MDLVCFEVLPLRRCSWFSLAPSSPPKLSPALPLLLLLLRSSAFPFLLQLPRQLLSQLLDPLIDFFLGIHLLLPFLDSLLVLLFQSIPFFKAFHFDSSSSIVLEDLLVWLPLSEPFFWTGVVCWSWVAGAQIGEVALDVAGCAAATGGREADVG